MKSLSSLLPLFLLAAAPAFAAPAACPQVADQMTELLASAKQRLVRDGDVRVEFEVDAGGRPQLVSVAGSRAYRAPVRLALDALDCRAGEPQRYVLNIRFADPVTVLAAAPGVAASSTLAQALDRR